MTPADFAIKWLDKIPLIRIKEYVGLLEAISHFCGMFFISHLLGWYGVIIGILWVALKEFHLDGHLKRIMNGTETKEETEDLISDIITNFLGLIVGII